MNTKSHEQIHRRGETPVNLSIRRQRTAKIKAYRPPTLSLAESTPSTPRNIWQDGVGNGFREHTFDAGFSIGAGFGTRVFGNTIAHDLALASGSFGWVFSDVVAKDK